MQNPPPFQPNPYGAPGGGANEKSSTGLDGNIAALVSYILSPLTGLIFFLIEKESRFVRFHAMQSLLFGAAMIILSIVFTFLSTMLMFISGVLAGLFGLLSLLVWLGFFVLWILCLVKAYQGQMFKLPVVGDMAANIVNK